MLHGYVIIIYLYPGYVEATVIPINARNIRVEEVAEANNYLALRNDKGEYYLNGHWFIQWSGDYKLAGTIVHYRREGNKESFNASGPLLEPLHIMVIHRLRDAILDSLMQNY